MDQAFNELEFQRAIRNTEWFKEFVGEYGEEPNLDSGDYDYRKAWAAGIRPERSKHDAGRYHWASSTPTGEMLKSKNHPTAWKEYYARTYGVDPDDVGASTRLFLGHEKGLRKQLNMGNVPADQYLQGLLSQAEGLVPDLANLDPQQALQFLVSPKGSSVLAELANRDKAARGGRGFYEQANADLGELASSFRLPSMSVPSFNMPTIRIPQSTQAKIEGRNAAARGEPGIYGQANADLANYVKGLLTTNPRSGKLEQGPTLEELYADAPRGKAGLGKAIDWLGGLVGYGDKPTPAAEAAPQPANKPVTKEEALAQLAAYTTGQPAYGRGAGYGAPLMGKAQVGEFYKAERDALNTAYDKLKEQMGKMPEEQRMEMAPRLKEVYDMHKAQLEADKKAGMSEEDKGMTLLKLGLGILGGRGGLTRSLAEAGQQATDFAIRAKRDRAAQLQAQRAAELGMAKELLGAESGDVAARNAAEQRRFDAAMKALGLEVERSKLGVDMRSKELDAGDKAADRALRERSFALQAAQANKPDAFETAVQRLMQGVKTGDVSPEEARARRRQLLFGAKEQKAMRPTDLKAAQDVAGQWITAYGLRDEPAVQQVMLQAAMNGENPAAAAELLRKNGYGLK